MDWTPQEDQHCELTILVVDLRNSSEFFRQSELLAADERERARDHVREFVRELSVVTHNAVIAWSNQRNDEVRIVKFTGDGFMILLAAPDGASGSPLGPSRAVAIASTIRREMRGICDRWDKLRVKRVSAGDVGTVSSVVHGTVRYGKVAIPAVDGHDALGEPVVKAFRFAQLRAFGPSDGNSDLLILCTETERQVRALLTDASADDHQQQLASRIRRLTFAKVLPSDLPDGKAGKGVHDPTLWVHVWEDGTIPRN